MFSPVTYLEKLIGVSRMHSPENQLPGPLIANPDLLPPGGMIFEDGSYMMDPPALPPPPPMGRMGYPIPPRNEASFLPGLFGGPEPDNYRPSTFKTYG